MPDVKVYGPYPHRGSWRCYIRSSTGNRRWCPSGPTREAALEHGQDAIEGYRAQAALTIGGLAEVYIESMRANDRAATTITSARNKLDMMMTPIRDSLAAALTPARAKARYLELVPTCAAATHHGALKRARAMWTWAIGDGLLKVNPWTSVKQVGRAVKGKAQLTLDESNRLGAELLKEADTSDPALALLICLFCGVRTSEIQHRVVRDVDAQGTRLLIPSSKTPSGVRPVELPPVIQPAIALRVAGRAPGDSLLRCRTGSPARKTWLRFHLDRYCERAGVPRVVPHGLRGGWASVAYGTGALSHAVAAAMGHASATVTEAHYATHEAVTGAKQAERLRNFGVHAVSPRQSSPDRDRR